MKTAKVSGVVKVYSVACPYCSGELAEPNTGSLDFYSNEQHGQTATCTVCRKESRLPKTLREFA